MEKQRTSNKAKRHRPTRKRSSTPLHAVVRPRGPEPVYRLMGAKIEQLRTLLGWTQQNFADRVGMARSSIANIEAGRQRFLLHDVETFAAAFQTTPKALLRGVWK